MRYATGVFVLALIWSASAQAGLLDPAAVEASRFVPPPPADGSADNKAEFAELKAIAARSTPAELAAAAHDARDEKPDLFNSTLGFDISALPETDKLLTMVLDEEAVDVGVAKKYFHRVRPYSADPTIKTCEPVKPGKSANSYPSGHSTLAFSIGVVLAALLPAKSQAILARASEYAEHRLVCGVHFRSDIVAGQQYGTIVALKLMENPTFQAQMAKAQAELAAHT
ncbi:MAG TPA: phosphatase PAP2 family protein [Rhizomicrobium sp.]|jgi:acid phosphatase (class A)|nr:phosphatase PAP2 family protein [Rhizomicrobium sp.]